MTLTRDDIKQILDEHEAAQTDKDGAKSLRQLTIEAHAESVWFGAEMKRRTQIFQLLHHVDLLADDFANIDPDPDPNGHGLRRSAYLLARAYADALVGQGALMGMIDGGFDVLMDYVIEKLDLT